MRLDRGVILRAAAMAWLLSMLTGCALVGARTPSAPAPNPGSPTNVAPASRAPSVTLPSLTSTAAAPTSELPSQLPIRLDGTTQVWNNKTQTVQDISRRRRHDFFLSSRVNFPANLTLGRYMLKVTIIDRQANRVAEASLPVQFVSQ